MPWVGNPVLSARAMFGVPDDRAAIYALLVGLPLDLSGRQALRFDEADALVEASSAALEAAQNDARADAALAYVEVVAADALREQREGRVQLAEDLLARTETLVRAGAATQVDLALIEAELGDARGALRGAEAEAARSRAALRALLDLEAEDPVSVAPLEVPVSPEGALSAWRERARARRAEPRAYAARARQLRISEDRLFAEIVDPLLVGLEWESQGNSQTAHTMGVSLSTTLPVARTAQGERAVARGERERARIEQGLAERAVERDVVGAAERLEAHLAELEALASAALPAMERAREGTLVQLERGATDLFRVIGTQRHVHLGAVVDPTEPLVRIADLSSVWILLSLFERDLGRVRVGDRVEVLSEVSPGTVFHGVVEHVGAVVDAETRTADVRVAVENVERRLRPGQFVHAALHVGGEARHDAILLPEAAISQIQGQPSVFVRIGPDRYDVRALELGPAHGARVEVRRGLAVGDEVVLEGAFALKSDLER